MIFRTLGGYTSHRLYHLTGIAQSENKLQCELDFPAAGGGGIKSTCRAIGRSVLIKQNVVDEWRVEIGVIEQVENLCAKLQVQTFSNCGVFDKGEVEVDQAGAVDFVSSAGTQSVRAVDRTAWRRSSCRGERRRVTEGRRRCRQRRQRKARQLNVASGVAWIDGGGTARSGQAIRICEGIRTPKPEGVSA